MTRAMRDRFFIAALLLAPPVWLLVYIVPLPALSGYQLSLTQLFLQGLLFPVLEELAFRGLVQGYLLRLPLLAERQLGVTGANGVTSLLFAAAHLIHRTPDMAALTFFPSLIFGELRDRFGTTRQAIFMHVYYNLGLLLVLAHKPV